MNDKVISNYINESLTKIENESLIKALEKGEWDKWAKVIENRLNIFFDRYIMEFKDEDDSVLAIDLRWDERESETRIMISA